MTIAPNVLHFAYISRFVLGFAAVNLVILRKTASRFLRFAEPVPWQRLLSLVNLAQNFTRFQTRLQMLARFHVFCRPQNFSRRRVHRDGIAARQHLFRPQQTQPRFRRLKTISPVSQMNVRQFAQTPLIQPNDSRRCFNNCAGRTRNSRVARFCQATCRSFAPCFAQRSKPACKSSSRCKSSFRRRRGCARTMRCVKSATNCRLAKTPSVMISAAALGVAARTSATKSLMVKSISCPTADTTGMADSKIARATTSSLNAHKSSSDRRRG